MWPVVGALATEWLGSEMQGQHNAAEAGKNRRWQQFMSSTAYSRAAHDLKSAGLNRILALGNPATTPSGATSAIEKPNFSQAAISAASAKQAISLQKAEESLVGQKESESKSSEALNKAMELTQGTQQMLNSANASSAIEQAKLLAEQARKVRLEADRTDAFNPIYRGIGDVIKSLDSWIRFSSRRGGAGPIGSFIDKAFKSDDSGNSGKYKWWQDDPDKGFFDEAKKKAIEARAKKGYPFKYSDERGYYD